MVEFISEICRTCLEDTKLLQSLYNVEHFAERTSKLGDFLKELTGIDFSQEDGLPSFMCQECIQKMSIAIQFKEMCLTSNDILWGLRGNNTKIKIEEVILEELPVVQGNDDLPEVKKLQRITRSIAKTIKQEPVEESIAGTSYDTMNMMDEFKPKRRARKPSPQDFSQVLFPHGDWADLANVYDSSDELAGRTPKVEQEIPKRREQRRPGKSKKAAKKKIRKPETPQYKYKCNECEREFRYGTTYRNHLQVKHSDETPFTCAHCEKKFKTKISLKGHIIRHRSYKPFKCKTCGMAFVLKGVFKVHKLTHNGKKPFLCTLCGKRFAVQGYLNTHMYSHSTERPFNCKICNKSFKTRGNLASHERSHTEPTKYECSVCGKKFHTKQLLREHAITHTKLRPHVCNYCNKSFNKKQILKRHIQLHTGERKFKCSKCPMSYIQREGYVRHMAKHEAEGS